ncbi:MAG TPA: histidinol-phosphate transaminase [Polyangiaceae bacterium]|jgi:histidinol-phosphate aminotransferase|nr:histidinol-phosphate transaminase [Polyangiaceae bacterium]
MSVFRKNVESMTAYVPGEQPPAGARVVKLNTNENPYPPSPTVARAIATELGSDGARLRLYSDPTARALREAASTRFGMPVNGILAGNGSDELLSLLVRAVVEPGELIVYPYPTYVLYETLAESGAARIKTPAFGRDFALPRALYGSTAKLTFIASPNSPSGNSHPLEALDELAASLRGGLLVIDEAYADFAETNALELVRTRPNVVVLRTFSKSYSLAGMRLGLLFASEELVKGIGKIKDSYNLDRLAIVAGAAALADDAWMRDNVAKIRATRARLVEGLKARGLDVLPSAANFVFARFPSADAARAAYHTLKGRGILVRYFDRPLLDDGLRITVGTDAEIAEFFAAL